MKDKQALAPRNRLLILLMPFIVCLCLLTLLFISLRIYYPIWIWILVPMILFIGGYFNWKYQHSFDLFFDSNYLYLENDHVTRQIPLHELSLTKNNTFRIKVMGFDYQKIQLVYRNKEGELQKVSCWISMLNDAWPKLEAYLKNK